METAAPAVAGEEETRMIPVMAGVAAPAAVVMAALEGAAVQTIPETEEEAPAVAAVAAAILIRETEEEAAAVAAAILIRETEEEAAAVVLRTIPETAAPAPVLIPGLSDRTEKLDAG